MCNEIRLIGERIYCQMCTDTIEWQLCKYCKRHDYRYLASDGYYCDDCKSKPIKIQCKVCKQDKNINMYHSTFMCTECAIVYREMNILFLKDIPKYIPNKY